MGHSDLDPRRIDPNLYVDLPIEKLYQYEYIAQLENYGIITMYKKEF